MKTQLFVSISNQCQSTVYECCLYADKLQLTAAAEINHGSARSKHSTTGDNAYSVSAAKAIANRRHVSCLLNRTER